MNEWLKSIQFHQSRKSAQPEGEHKKVLVKIYTSLNGSPEATPFAAPVTCDMIGNQIAV